MARTAFISFFDEWAPPLRQLAACLREDGHEVLLTFLKTHSEIRFRPSPGEAADFFSSPPFAVSVRELELLLELLEEFRPDFVGITVMSVLEDLAAGVTGRVRKDLGVPVAWGGSPPTLDPAGAEKHADIVCVGEGERAVVELARLMDSTGGRPGRTVIASAQKPIENLRLRTDRGWLRAEGGVMIEDLDALPFPLVDPRFEAYVTAGGLVRGEYPPSCRVPASLPANSGRGCPFSCSYCNHPVLRETYRGSRYVRRRTPENFVEELRQRKEAFPKLALIEMCDPIFIMNDSWCTGFADLYEKRVGIPFLCYAYPGSVREPVLRRLKKAGLQSVIFGLQSGSDRTLRKIYHRPTPRATILKTAALLHELDIPYSVDLIGSNPFETDEDRMETVRILAGLPKPYFVRPVQPLQFYPGHQITEKAREDGISLIRWRGEALLASPSRRYRSWDALMILAQFPGIFCGDLEALAADGSLMDRPEVLEDLAAAVTAGTYLRGNVYDLDGVDYEEQVHVTKESRIRQLETELRTLRGSRLVRAAMLLRDALCSVRRRPRGGRRAPEFLTT